MSRVTDGWNGKIEEFEKINAGLQSSLSQLRDENELLRLKVGANIFCLISSNICLSQRYLYREFPNTADL